MRDFVIRLFPLYLDAEERHASVDFMKRIQHEHSGTSIANEFLLAHPDSSGYVVAQLGTKSRILRSVQ